MTTQHAQAAVEGPWPQMRIRFATRDDLPELMRLCRSLAGENAIAPMMDDLVHMELLQSIDRQGGCIGVIGDPGRIEGAICLRLNHLWYNTGYFWLEDRFAYVYPQHRASNNASDLLDWARWWAVQLDIPLMLGIVSNERTQAKIRLYERKLGAMSGALFLVGATTGLKG